ncbi:MAG: ribosome assembly factor SBDS [Candidatus Diapherotrites archaeon]|uniref:Ribosome maturation protein SDO1 homolog n=1 Tax=Candidatus Iainarchaeum sp. TaxID=3101447 RepID=A0A2D6LPM6_9ARCH|nr:ribosome assembly factor SBDS [Candidatus Diapherotrites archaeon]|tara:strand:- start:1517 stop:2218 length:702 start_codon:yes stop_codon:yes gene_type:complete
MVRTEDAVIARYEHSGEKFEILVDPDLAMDLKHGKEVNFDDLLAIDTVFKDAKKGEDKSEETLQKVFNTTDAKEIAKRIIEEGEVQLTTDQRRAITEKKRKEIIAFISANAINPQTSAPHPVQRIENALNEVKFNVDLNKTVKEQVTEIVKEIKKILPISMEKMKIAVRIPAQFSGAASVILHKYGLEKEEWQNDGSLVAMLEIPAGIKQDLFNELNHLTHGDVETKIIDDKR